MSSIGQTVPLVTLEEHFTSNAAAKLYGSPAKMFGPVIGAKLTSMTSPRIADMDAAGVSKQILSHTPFPEAPSLELCKEINDELYAAVKPHANRLVGFASLPMHQPRDAAAELKRAVTELGFVGALVDTHTDGIWYDGKEWDVFWQTACELSVPIYLHPCFASEEMLRINYRSESYPNDVATSLGAFVFGWHTETGLHFLRLFAAGVFDRFPDLKICLGHMGECIPYMFERQVKSTGRWSHIKRPLQTVWNENIWVTTSGMFDTTSLRCVLKASPIDHVMLSIDYPFSATEQGRKFVQDIEAEGLITGANLEAFTHGNATKLLRLSK